jgi:hypothetical protein
MAQINPLAAVTPVRDRESSEYPDRIRVAMEDGKVLTYVMEVEQPHPSFVEAIDCLNRLCDIIADASATTRDMADEHSRIVLGYQYQPKKRRRRSL